jgi:beta-galactosidase GanA
MHIFLGEKPERYFPFSRGADPEDIMKLTWGAIARGAKGLLYWGWRPDLSSMETLSLGLVERDGELTDRSEIVKCQSEVIARNSELIEARSPKSEVAVLYNLDSIIQEGISSLARAHSRAVDLEKHYYKDILSFFGCYKLCSQKGIRFDFISDEQLAGGKLDEYKLLILPYSINITRKLAEQILIFIKQGGKVISDGMCGFFTDGGWGSEVCPPHGLSKAFGFKVKSNYDLIDECGVKIDGTRIDHFGRFFTERFALSGDAKVIGVYDDGKPAIIANKYEKGKVVYAGTALFCEALIDKTHDTSIVFDKLLKSVEYSPLVEIFGVSAGKTVEVRKQVTNGCEFVFIISHSDKQEKVTIRVPIKNGTKTKSLWDENTMPVLRDGVLSVQAEMSAMQILIYRID